jgi:hypothetical protein
VIAKEFVRRDGRVLCRVTFSLPTKMWSESIYLVGDFNGWSQTAHRFIRSADGTYSVTLELECGRTYQFRYLEEGHNWLNDSQADGCVPNSYGGANCLLDTSAPASAERPVEAA